MKRAKNSKGNDLRYLDLSSVGHTIMADGVTDVSKPDNKETIITEHVKIATCLYISSQIILQPDGYNPVTVSALGITTMTIL